jgi:hypothetical protein
MDELIDGLKAGKGVTAMPQPQVNAALWLSARNDPDARCGRSP